MRVKDQDKLLQLVEETVQACVRGQEPPGPPDDLALQEPQAMFVTLRVSGELRGCIGSLEPQRGVATTAIEAARAALEDRRFADCRVQTSELDGLSVELTLLGPRQPIGGVDEIEIGRHGVVLAVGEHTGVFLPQVAVEQGWDATELLENLCTKKLGLPAGAWRVPEAKLWVMEGEKLVSDG